MSMSCQTPFTGLWIAVFYPQHGFLTNPTMACIAEELIAMGARVDVYSPLHDSAAQVRGVVHKMFPSPFKLWGGSWKNTRDGWRQRMVSLARREDFLKQQYDLVIGVNSAGLIEAHKYHVKYGVPLVYIPFEIFFRDELTLPGHIAEKTGEIRASQDAAIVLVQDPVRGRLLARENGLDEKTFVYMPVAPRSENRITKRNVIRSRFAIPEENIILLHSGSFTYWTYSKEIIESARQWPSNITLFIHTPSPVQPSSLPVQTGGAQVIFDHHLLDGPAYADLILSADCGLVMYKPGGTRYENRNLEVIGLASGKFSSYLNHGLPVIAVKQQTYRDLLASYPFGEVVDDLDQIPAAALRIAANSATHRAQSKRLFNEKLDFNAHWPHMKAALQRVLVAVEVTRL
jgi:hypothetical protein